MTNIVVHTAPRVDQEWQLPYTWSIDYLLFQVWELFQMGKTSCVRLCATLLSLCPNSS